MLSITNTYINTSCWLACINAYMLHACVCVCYEVSECVFLINFYFMLYVTIPACVCALSCSITLIGKALTNFMTTISQWGDWNDCDNNYHILVIENLCESINWYGFDLWKMHSSMLCRICLKTYLFENISVRCVQVKNGNWKASWQVTKVERL